jgi:hypothetical protein
MNEPSVFRELSPEEFERLGPEEKRNYLTEALETRSKAPSPEPEQPQAAPETPPQDTPPLKT